MKYEKEDTFLSIEPAKALEKNVKFKFNKDDECTGITHHQAEMINLTYKANDDIKVGQDTLKSKSN